MAITHLMPNRDTVPGLAARLKAAREKAELSQSEAASRAGLYQANIARFETDKGTPTLRVLLKLAEAYGVDVCDLIREPKRKK